MSDYTMPVKLIKSLLDQEIEKHGDALKKYTYNDVQKEMIHIAKKTMLLKLDACQSYNDLEEFLSFSGYRMSVQDWINSL
jgi:hypothetical protein